MTQLQRDLDTLGLHVTSDLADSDPWPPPTVSFWDTPETRGAWTDARMEVVASNAKPTIWAQLFTPFKLRSQMVGKAVAVVTITCPDGVILGRSYPIKCEVAARRVAAYLNSAARP